MIGYSPPSTTIGEHDMHRRRPGAAIEIATVRPPVGVPIALRRHLPSFLMQLPACRCPRFDDGQPQHRDEIIVRGDPIVALEPARETAMHQRMLALPAREHAHGRHRSAAIARAVAGRPAIDVPRVEAPRAVVAVHAARWRRAYHRAAVAASELLLADPCAGS